MASGGHVLQQQRPHVETRIKGLVNENLKEICRAYGQGVTGTKAVLQGRCISVLDNIVRKGDVTSFEEFRYRVNNRGASPARGYSNSPSTSYPTPPSHPTPSYSNSYPTSTPGSGSYSSYNTPPYRPGMTTAQRLPTGRSYFKSSPFYESKATLSPLQDLPEMPQNRHTVKAYFTIGQETAQEFRSDSNMRILIYCGMAHAMNPYAPTDVAFPNQIEVKVNDQDVKSNFKGLKNKPGSTKPADITSFVRKFGGQQNTISITYALTTKRFAFGVYLVRYINADRLIEKIENGAVIPKQKVLDVMSAANADPDIEATSVRMSLKDPISTMRISLPVRSSHCTHNQCFDGAMFLQLQEQAPQWSCPVCTKSVPFESLCVDKYFEDILARTGKNIEKVDVEPNGQWTVIREEDLQQPNGRASYDDDFDDLVEVDAPGAGGGMGTTSAAPLAMTSIPLHAPSASAPGVGGGTPAAVSASPAPQPQAQGQKRPQSSVIDLTLSDDEDEPPRPANRARIA